MWKFLSLTRWLFLLALWLLSCSGCSAADWTVTRTTDHSRVSRFRPQPQVIVVPVQMPAARPSATVALEREPTPATLPPLLTIPSAVAPQVLPAIPVAPEVPRKKVSVTVEK